MSQIGQVDLKYIIIHLVLISCLTINSIVYLIIFLFWKNDQSSDTAEKMYTKSILVSWIIRSTMYFGTLIIIFIIAKPKRIEFPRSSTRLSAEGIPSRPISREIQPFLMHKQEQATMDLVRA